jgi:nicotinamidase-related amidase
MGSGLTDIPIRHAVHLCIDMQNIFARGGLWETPWMARVLPVVEEIAGRFAPETIFTRFITPQTPDHAHGAWRRYYRKWDAAVRTRLPAEMLELVPSLARFCPPARTLDKPCYSAFVGTPLQTVLSEKGADTLVVSGSETDVCVLATVLHAVDLGYRVIVIHDAVCSSSDEGHDALMRVLHGRYSEQIETAYARDVVERWADERATP